MSGRRSSPQCADRPAKECAALCGAAKSPGIAVRAILLEKLANAVLDYIDILQGDAETSGDFLRGNLEAFAKDKNLEIAERDILLRLCDVLDCTLDELLR